MMYLYTIWVRGYSDDGMPWCCGAWDEFSVEENPEGYADAIAHYEGKYGIENIRVVKVLIMDAPIANLFEPLTVTGEVEVDD